MQPPDPVDFDAFARFYDLDYGDFTDDLAFYQGFAARTGGPILEVGSGTGRVLLPLAAAGYRVTGVDVSLAMLKVAENKLKAAGIQAQLRQGDVRDLRFAEGYRLVIVATDSFMHLTTLEDQQRATRKLHDLLEMGGLLLVDLFHPHPERLLIPDKELLLAWTKRDPATGRLVSKLVSRETELGRQIQHVTFFYDEIDEQGRISRLVAPFVLRYLFRYEMALLLQGSGFAVEQVYGSYELDDFDADSERMIFVARRNE